MMTIAYLAVLTIGCALMLAWGFRRLPAENWQIAATVPLVKNRDGHWQGRNLTFYGIFTANAYVVAVAHLIVLMASVRVPIYMTFGLVALVLAVCVPSSRWVARWIEGKQHTFTVAGAFFVGILITPVMVWLVNHLTGFSNWIEPIPTLPMLAAAAVCYALGEGLGRLACISFGCCYGCSVTECSPRLQRWLAPCALVFNGPTKKASYEGGYEGVPLVPIQALTATLLTSVALLGSILFFLGYFRSALVLTLVVSQLWRVASELLRADYRGTLKFSPYQIMALGGAVYGAAAAWIIELPSTLLPDGALGVEQLWSPAVILLLQGLWAVIFLFTGRSEVTASDISIHVLHERV